MQDVKKEMTNRRIFTVLGNLLYTGIYEHSNWVPSRNLLVCTEFELYKHDIRKFDCQLKSDNLQCTV